MNAARRAVLLVAFVIAVVGPATASAHDHDGSHADPAAHHSLRQPVTDQNFYFVMADRFDNGDPANDNGDLPPGTEPASPASTRPARAGTTAAT